MVVIEIEYLAVYNRALDHQRQHGTLFPSIHGVEQPSEICYRCLDEKRSDAQHGGFHDVKRRFSWAVPTVKALDVIAARSPRGVVEIGAGGGYWAMLLRQRGVDVAAYDPHPPSEQNGFATHRWDEVLLGDHTAVIGHPDRTLLLCWPAYDAGWTGDAVDLYDGDTVIYVGEGSGGCTGDDRMHALLGETPYCSHWQEPCTCEWPAAKFKEVDSVSIPQWGGLHDSLFVYERAS